MHCVFVENGYFVYTFLGDRQVKISFDVVCDNEIRWFLVDVQADMYHCFFANGLFRCFSNMLKHEGINSYSFVAKSSIIEPCYEKNVFFFAYAKTKTQISCAVTAQLISAFVFATRIVQFLYFLNPKFQVSSHLLWMYSLVCVGPGRKTRRPVFSQRGSIIALVKTHLLF